MMRVTALMMPRASTASWIMPASVTIASVAVVTAYYLWSKLRATEKRLLSMHEHEAATKKHEAALAMQCRTHAEAGASAMLNEWADGTDSIHAKDLTDAVRGRRDPTSKWATQKAKWPPQRIEFMAQRFAGPDKKFSRPQLAALCQYMTECSHSNFSDELDAAWESCERLRHKTGHRESLLPVAQLRQQQPLV